MMKISIATVFTLAVVFVAGTAMVEADHNKDIFGSNSCIKYTENGALPCPDYQPSKDKKCRFIRGKRNAPYPICCSTFICEED
ncbi:hypothetical protein BDF19DRAFT_448941 [Syncephalis fuscata]|nr:hypothetical protein BDF19DRAFT_448941 [Syncephalis fuscata]